MKFNSDSAKIKFNSGTSKEALDQGYEIVPMNGNLAGDVANRRLGITNQWTSICEPEDKTTEYSD